METLPESSGLGDGEGCLLVQIPARRAKGDTPASPARKERIPLIKVDEVVVLAR